jgi:hypothetical protein
MNERQRDLLLWQWSKRRTPGQHAIGLRGAVIGALGGILFGLLLAPGPAAGVHAYDFLGQLLSGFGVYVLSIPAFAVIGWSGARRVFASQEAIYQSLLAAGARVPDHKPVMQARDRGPAIAVGIAVTLIAGFVLFVVIKLG